MSQVVDSQAFSPAERTEMLDEIRDYLPGFLASSAGEGVGPIDKLDELLNLRRQDLDRVVALHLALADPIVDLIRALRHGLRRPATSSVRPRVTTQVVRGPIDWGATIRARAQQMNDPTLFVVRPAERVFDTPENRALVWMLRRLEALFRQVAPASLDERVGVHDEGWFAQVIGMRQQLGAVRRVAWLRGVQPERPGPLTIKRLRASRLALYKTHLPAAYAEYARFEDPSTDEITELLGRRLFEPRRTWMLFELLVALRLSRAFAATAQALPSRLLVGGSRGPFARFRLDDGDEVRLWYQGWPEGAGPSLHAQARERHKIAAGATRPDLMIERRGAQPDVVIVEAKATRSPGYLGDGLSQLLGYIKERSSLWSAQNPGWLVAPPSPAFESAQADGELWVVSADDIAPAAIARFASGA